ncbi:SAM-dependent methyltransferase [Nocardioides gansuensis]|uniref:SAM-dependent methyltransferase n=2 Tax=Nocardioides gansuensis TaxID=2138300 RepID=A0A2T8FGM5_9ACTN|nr:SAM-dependent methyltransferase [Nocardioides gansuensis]
MIEERLTGLVEERLAARGRCRVLEVGAGHGTFTRTLVRAGAEVTVTEASRASADLLCEEFVGSGSVEVLHDATGEQVLERAEQWDLAVMIAVLHHIPDYLSFLDRLCDRVAPGGLLFTAMDPLYYPRMSGWAHRADKAGYLTWRLFQGNYRRGLATRWRRLRGIYDETQESDLVEYHTVRQGVDEEAIADLLGSRFDAVEVFSHWSHQAPLFQWLGDRTSMRTTFGICARGRR